MTEVNALKKSLKNSDDENVNTQKALEAKSRDLKEKDKLMAAEQQQFTQSFSILEEKQSKEVDSIKKQSESSRKGNNLLICKFNPYQAFKQYVYKTLRTLNRFLKSFIKCRL